jgi:hydrogenase 3 maturation protease
MQTLQTLKTNLQQRLENALKIGVLGIGSELRADDAAGILVAQRVEELMGDKKTHPQIETFIGATAPENLTGEIKRFAPTHLVIVDAADLDSEPGTITLMDPDSIGGTTFCTHSLPLKVMIDYLLDSFECDVIIVGIQPKSLAVGASVSNEVLNAVQFLATTICDAISHK